MAEKRKEISTPQKQLVISLRQDKFRQYKIAGIIGVSQSCISKFLRKFNRSGNIENLPRSGRPQKTDERGERKILRCLLLFLAELLEEDYVFLALQAGKFVKH